MFHIFTWHCFEWVKVIKYGMFLYLPLRGCQLGRGCNRGWFNRGIVFNDRSFVRLTHYLLESLFSFCIFLVFHSVSLYPNSIKIKIRSLLHIFQRFIVFLFLYFSMFGVFEKYLICFRENDGNGTGSDPIWPTDSTLGIGGTESTSKFKNFTFWIEATWGWNL